jgi:hypothetical protein
LSCFFLAQVQHGGGGWSANVFFACGWIGLLIFLRNEKKQCAKCGLIAKSVTEKNSSRVDCAEADKKTVQAQRNEGRGFLEAVDCLAELLVIYLQAEPDRLISGN